MKLLRSGMLFVVLFTLCLSLQSQTDSFQTLGDYSPVPSASTPENAAGESNASVASRSPSAEWEKLDGCRFKTSAYHDADSFHVMHGGKEYIFRLYHVDAPEVDKEFPERVAAQKKYFAINQATLFQVAQTATLFTEQQLTGGFTVYTRWQDARGNSQLPRYYGLVAVRGVNLGQLLVEQGLARVHGAPANGNPFQPEAKILAALHQAESEARTARRGAWATTKKKG
jgi:endonuclease YncB( thermonuclease family)